MEVISSVMACTKPRNRAALSPTLRPLFASRAGHRHATETQGARTLPKWASLSLRVGRGRWRRMAHLGKGDAPPLAPPCTSLTCEPAGGKVAAGAHGRQRRWALGEVPRRAKDGRLRKTKAYHIWDTAGQAMDALELKTEHAFSEGERSRTKGRVGDATARPRMAARQCSRAWFGGGEGSSGHHTGFKPSQYIDSRKDYSKTAPRHHAPLPHPPVCTPDIIKVPENVCCAGKGYIRASRYPPDVTWHGDA